MAATEKKYDDIPDVSFTDFIFNNWEERILSIKERPWLVDVPSNKTVTYGQVKENAINIASALSKRGFKQGDCLYFVTFELAYLFLVKIGVWMLGGVTRGCDQHEPPEVYEKQIKEVQAKFIVVDADTINVIKEALQHVEFDVKLISLGDEELEGTEHVSKLLEDGENEIPLVKINATEDPMVIFNTSGSTGFPKGVLHTHRSCTAFVMAFGGLKTEETLLQFSINYGVGILGIAFYYFNLGRTVYHINKFEKNSYFDQIMAYKPQSLLMYPFIGNWFARCDAEIATLRHENFLKFIMIGGWVLDPTTADLLSNCLPNTHLEHIYGMSEICFAAASFVTGVRDPQKLLRCTKEGHTFISTGPPLPRVEIKIIDMVTSETLKSLEEGEVCVRSPTTAKGRGLGRGYQVDSSPIDVEGWLKTGDIGFLDDKGRLYIKDRVKFIYRVLASFVSSVEIESVLQQHPSVLEAGVVAIPDVTMNNLSRAFVVLKPGGKSSEDDLCKFVEVRMPYYKWLHGGVRFIEKLPANKGGKLDRKALKDFALNGSNLSK